MIFSVRFFFLLSLLLGYHHEPPGYAPCWVARVLVFLFFVSFLYFSVSLNCCFFHNNKYFLFGTMGRSPGRFPAVSFSNCPTRKPHGAFLEARLGVLFATTENRNGSRRICTRCVRIFYSLFCLHQNGFTVSFLIINAYSIHLLSPGCVFHAC